MKRTIRIDNLEDLQELNRIAPQHVAKAMSSFGKKAGGALSNAALGATMYGAGVIPAINKSAKEYERTNPKSAMAAQLVGGLVPLPPILKGLKAGKSAVKTGAQIIKGADMYKKAPLKQRLLKYAAKDHPMLRNAGLGAAASVSHDTLYDKSSEDSVAGNAIGGALGGAAIGALGAGANRILNPKYKAHKFLNHFDEGTRNRAIEEKIPLYEFLGRGGQSHELKYGANILSNNPKISEELNTALKYKKPKYPEEVVEAYKSALQNASEYPLYKSENPLRALKEYKHIATKMPDAYNFDAMAPLTPKQQELLHKNLEIKIQQAREMGDNLEAKTLTEIASSIGGNLGEKYKKARRIAQPYVMDRESTRNNYLFFKDAAEKISPAKYNKSTVPFGEIASEAIQQQTKNPTFSKAPSVWRRLSGAKLMNLGLRLTNPKQEAMSKAVFQDPRFLKALTKYSKNHKNLSDKIIKSLSRTRLKKEEK